MFRRVLLALALSATLCRGELVWDKAHQEFEKSWEDGELKVDFRFRNDGKQAVTITRVTASCGCMTTNLAQKTYRPGESGTIAARFSFGSRRGLQKKTVSVATDAGQVSQLSFDCLISEDPVRLTPSLVFWRVGEEARAKAVSVAVGGKPGVEVIGVASTNPRISAQLASTQVVGQYLVHVQPSDTAAAEEGEIFVQTNYPPDGPKAYTIHVRVR